MIDAHQHSFWHNRDAAALVADMDAQGIDLAWLLTWEIAPTNGNFSEHKYLNPLHVRPDGTHAGIPLSDVLRTCETWPDRFIPGYCPDPMLPTAPDLFEAAWNMFGVRICGEWKFRVLLDDPRCLNLFRRCGRLGAPVIVHIDVPYRADGNGGVVYDPCWYGGTIDNLARTLEACPETNFLGHAPGFWREIGSDADSQPDLYPEGELPGEGRLAELFDQYPNLYGDLSAGSARRALQRSPEYTREFFVRFADRLLFARDCYGGELHEFLQGLELPADVQRKIYGENAQRLVSS